VCRLSEDRGTSWPDAALASLLYASTRVLVLTQKAVLYLCVDSVQPHDAAAGSLSYQGARSTRLASR
jgi:hypothetical protein